MSLRSEPKSRLTRMPIRGKFEGCELPDAGATLSNTQLVVSSYKAPPAILNTRPLLQDAAGPNISDRNRKSLAQMSTSTVNHKSSESSSPFSSRMFTRGQKRPDHQSRGPVRAAVEGNRGGLER